VQVCHKLTITRITMPTYGVRRGQCLPGRKSRASLLNAAVKGLTTSLVQSGRPGLLCELMSCIGVFTLHFTDVNRGFGTIGRKQTQLPDSEGN